MAATSSALTPAEQKAIEGRYTVSSYATREVGLARDVRTLRQNAIALDKRVLEQQKTIDARTKDIAAQKASITTLVADRAGARLAVLETSSAAHKTALERLPTQLTAIDQRVRTLETTAVTKAAHDAALAGQTASIAAVHKKIDETARACVEKGALHNQITSDLLGMAKEQGATMSLLSDEVKRHKASVIQEITALAGQASTKTAALEQRLAVVEGQHVSKAAFAALSRTVEQQAADLLQMGRAQEAMRAEQAGDRKTIAELQAALGQASAKEAANEQQIASLKAAQEAQKRAAEQEKQALEEKIARLFALVEASERKLQTLLDEKAQGLTASISRLQHRTELVEETVKIGHKNLNARLDGHDEQLGELRASQVTLSALTTVRRAESPRSRVTLAPRPLSPR